LFQFWDNGRFLVIAMFLDDVFSAHLSKISRESCLISYVFIAEKWLN